MIVSPRFALGEKARVSGFFALALLVALGLVVATPVVADKPVDVDELFNPILGLDYSHWLVGPVAVIASEEEIETYLHLTSDEEARAFIDAFWEKRAEGTAIFQKTPRQLFQERAEDADKRFSEGARPGRGTDRGEILILYGEPETIEFESPRKVGDPTLEVWNYPDDAPEGLDGEKPNRRYRFVDLGDTVVLYTGQKLRPSLRDRVRRY